MKAKGLVHKFGDNVDTDVIIPARYLNKSDEAWLASHCMEDIDAEFVNKVKPVILWLLRRISAAAPHVSTLRLQLRHQVSPALSHPHLQEFFTEMPLISALRFSNVMRQQRISKRATRLMLILTAVSSPTVQQVKPIRLSLSLSLFRILLKTADL